ncbi:ribosome-associated translation inhibitor RaiA [Agromyces fucosus]|uniref:Ribosome hibernation promoting factor n=1 Tax=Agromyces fucosus TaxID=41985 RepID=A0A4Q2JRN2_9MICO|nr:MULTISPECIES: ribosome-associated translation inhibitor RaiA [Agromyces]KQZ08705.1 RNA polymerase subunit sigma-54 [Agromyces sp. Root1464]RXZ50985.1 ribosome-associated translation inhibitor RaiA [Agromyces fucosus]
MELNIVGRNLGITDRFRAYVAEKSEKVSHLAERAISLDVKLSRHNEKNGNPGPDRVELTLVGKGPVVRAEADGSDKYAAFDVALGRLLERVRRAKDRRKVHRGGSRRPTSLREATDAGFSDVGVHAAAPEVLAQVRTGSIPVVDEFEPHVDEDEVYTPVVIRRKVFTATPMTVDDALYFMELVGHDFYLFVDTESGRPSVVYRRKGWDYGLIGLDERAEGRSPTTSPVELQRATA